MSYNLSVSDNSSSFNRYEMVSTDTIDYNLLFDLPFSPLFESSSDYNLQAFLNYDQSQQQNLVDKSTCSDQLVSCLLPSSPPTHQLENLSLYQTTQFQSLSFGPNLENGYEKFNSLNCLEVKNEECQVDFDSAFIDVQNVACLRSAFFAGEMRNVCSTGDLERSISSSSAIDNSFMEEAPFKVGRYNPEERQERISKYRAKRNQRNFNKTIKYACRKMLADNRPRIRGRFARNDETVEIPKAACSTRDEDDLWALHEMEDETMARGTYMNSFSQHQFQYHHGSFF